MKYLSYKCIFPSQKYFCYKVARSKFLQIIINRINLLHFFIDTKSTIYLSGINREECVAPIPGLPCLTGLYVTENSPR